MSTSTELERAKEQRLAATREALAKVIPLEWVSNREIRRGIADAILSSGILRDADEVRREAKREALVELPRYAPSGVKSDAELRARVQALCEQITAYRDDEAKFATPHLQQIHHRALTWALSSVRALLADDGAAALRERDERVRCEERRALAALINSMRPARARNELRDFDRGMERAEELIRATAEEAGE